MQSFEITFVKFEEIAPKVRHFYFEVDADKAITYQAGQFVTLMLEGDNKLVRRSYSLAAPPKTSENALDKHYIEFAASYVENGFASELLFNLTPGQKLTATGPFGRLILGALKPKRFVLMATGTGVTPYRAMMPSLMQFLSENEANEVVLLFGQRTLKDVLYHQEFVSLAEQNKRFLFKPYLSREEVSNLPAYAHKGYIQEGIEALNLNPEQDVVFLCGNPNMIDDAFEKLKEKGFSGQNAVREKYISSK